MPPTAAAVALAPTVSISAESDGLPDLDPERSPTMCGV
jgi:hypothetical protein